MSNNTCLWNFVLGNLEETTPVMLLYVVESRGSSPGRQGFCMAVNRHGITNGSIGGGIMEHKLVETAKDKLFRDWSGSIVQKQVHNKEAAKHQSGMICSGEQTIVLYRVRQADQAAVENLVNCLAQYQTGRLLLTPEGLDFSTGNVLPEKYKYEQQSPEDWRYEERIGQGNQLYIIGGGHCSLALSDLMRKMGFYIHVYEDRPTLNTFLENDFAQEKHVVKSYADLTGLINEEDAYVVIMTFGYRTDDIALRALVDKQFRYLGVLGSKYKIAKMFESWYADGISADKLKKIYAPAGIQIHSQTPEEIAVSIAAQIIAVRHAQEDEDVDTYYYL